MTMRRVLIVLIAIVAIIGIANEVGSRAAIPTVGRGDVAPILAPTNIPGDDSYVDVQDYQTYDEVILPWEGDPTPADPPPPPDEQPPPDDPAPDPGPAPWCEPGDWQPGC